MYIHKNRADDVKRLTQIYKIFENFPVVWVFVSNIRCMCQVYKDGILGLSCHCARLAASMGVQRFVEISEASMKASDKVKTHISRCLMQNIYRQNDIYR